MVAMPNHTPARCRATEPLAYGAGRANPTSWCAVSPEEPFAGAVGLHNTRVAALVREPPVTCGGDTSVKDLAASMTTGAARAVVVLDPGGAPCGIVTDRDLRAKVVALGRDPSLTTARAVMSSPLVTIAVTAFAVEALLEMTQREIHHLVVLDNGKLCGVISSDILVALPAAHPVVLARAIGRAASVPALAELATRAAELVRLLVERGTRAPAIAGIVAEINDRLVRRVLALSEAAVTARRGAGAPLPYCWLLFGSEGRREQTLRTDQDNGLVYADTDDEAAHAWFQALARETIDGLIAIGFPPCPGGAMASNPLWCRPLEVWKGYFRTWMESPTPQHALAASMYFDARPLAGEMALGTALTDVLRAEAPRYPHLLSTLARDVVDRALPRTLLGGIKGESRGPHRGTVDVKASGGMHLVATARIHALALGLADTNTIARFLGAAAAGIYSASEATEIVEAFEHLLHLRLVAQLDRLAQRAVPDNRVELRRLSRRDALLLRDAFATISRLQADLRERYRTDLMV
jgi:CBS domain-containing protein